MLLTIITKMFGLVRDMVLSYFYGASNISDIYLISIAIPSIIFGLIVTGLSTSYIPIFRGIEKEYGFKEANKYTNNLLTILLIIATVIIIGGLIFTEQIVKIVAFGFEGETLELAVKFTRISIIGIYFTAYIYIFNGFLQLQNNFSMPALSVLPMNIIIIIAVYISAFTDPLVLAIGTLIASAFQLLFIIPTAIRKGYKYKFVFDLKDKHLKSMLLVAIPVIIGASINQINQLVDRTIASQIEIGGITVLSYANRLNAFVSGIFILSISTVMYPLISKLAAEKNISEFKKIISQAMSGISLLIIPATLGAMLLAEPIVSIVFGRGAFDALAISATSNVLFFYSLGMIGYGLRDILSKAFYSLHDTKTPMINAIIVVIVNIILNIILSRHLGLGGIALATSIADIVCTTLLIIALRRKIGPFGLKQTLLSILKILLASLIMGFFVHLSYTLLLSLGEIIALLSSITFGILIYLVLIIILKIKETEFLLNVIKNKILINGIFK